MKFEVLLLPFYVTPYFFCHYPTCHQKILCSLTPLHLSDSSLASLEMKTLHAKYMHFQAIKYDTLWINCYNNISSWYASCPFCVHAEKISVSLHSPGFVNGKQIKWLRQRHTTLCGLPSFFHAVIH